MNREISTPAAVVPMDLFGQGCKVQEKRWTEAYGSLPQEGQNPTEIMIRTTKNIV